jgi:NADH dehydrogenase FAD-containing subunit
VHVTAAQAHRTGVRFVRFSIAYADRRQGSQMSSSSPIDVVVIGAGYAGVMAANRLLGSLTDVERRRVRVTVVNPRPDFVERIRLHELAAGTREVVSVPLIEVLHEDATLIVGTV